MSQASLLKFHPPFINTKTTSKNISPVSWGSRAAVTSSRAARSHSNWVSKLSLLTVVMLGVMLVLHLYWVNTYAAKGFALSAVQKAIKEQTDLQKKLLVQQALLNSTAQITDSSKTGLVSITDEEYLAPTNFASVH
jgi:hypothetical protein